MVRTEQIQIYKFSELGEEAKEEAIENQRNDEFYLDYEWYDGLHEGFIEELNSIGVDCKSFYWDLYKSRDFKAEDLIVTDNDKLLKSVGCINWLVMNELRTEKTLIYDISLSEYGEADIELDFELEDNLSNKEYEERGKETEEIEEKIKELFDEKFKKFWETINKEYDYLLSDEAISENLEINEYEFNKDGSRY